LSSAQPRPAVVLVSGGLDSATTLALAIERGFAAHALSVDYGQRHAGELDRAAEIAAASGAASHRVVHCDLGFFSGCALTDSATPVPRGSAEAEIGSEIPSTYVPARNTILLSLALGWAEVLGAHDLFIGANAVDYSGYPDCREPFLREFERLASLATRAGVGGERFRVHAPLLSMSKAEIVLEALRLGVDTARTLSCYDPRDDGHPCGECDACRLRAKGFREAGVEDPGL
jgi:7-cyano-7-deazaguanine synthase